jgi:hypothetical protein
MYKMLSAFFYEDDCRVLFSRRDGSAHFRFDSRFDAIRFCEAGHKGDLMRGIDYRLMCAVKKGESKLLRSVNECVENK